MSGKTISGKSRYDESEKLNLASELKKFSTSSNIPQSENPKNQPHALGSEDLQALYEVSRAVNSTLILDEILNIVMKKSIELLKAERGFLMLLDSNGKLQFKTAHNIKKQEIDKKDLQISTTIAEGVVKSGKSLYTSDALSDQRFFQKKSILEMNIRSAMCVPLKIKNQIIGVVYLDNSSKANIFLQSDLHLFEMFADQAALAIQNAQLYTELYALQRFQEAILDKTPVGIIVIEDNGEIISFNNAAFELFKKTKILNGAKSDSALGRNLIELLPKTEQNFWRENIANSKLNSVEIGSRRFKVGEDDIVLRLHFSLFDHHDDKKAGRIIVVEDITERVIIEQHLVLSEKLIARGEMAAAIGHELNNYLATISSNAQLLAINVTNHQYDKIDQKVENIVSHVDKMKRFTSGLMDFSSLDTKKAPGDIISLIDEVIFFAKPQQKFRGIKIETRYSTDNATIDMDSGQIHQVLLNLLMNSADAINEKKIENGFIKIETKSDDKKFHHRD